MSCQKWMVRDLKEKVQEQDAARDAAKKIQQLKITPDRGKVLEEDLNQVEEKEEVINSKGVYKKYINQSKLNK